jgi:RNA polymerase sigma-70 factor (ECF subfamily)
VSTKVALPVFPAGPLLRENEPTRLAGTNFVDTRTRYFEVAVWPHLRSAYNLARWLVRNDHDAEDVVQDAFLKAFQSLDTFRGGDPRLWMLAIVRNSAMNFLRGRKPDLPMDWNGQPEPPDRAPGPEQDMLDESRRQQVRRAIARLDPEFREALVLRDIEGLSYKEIAFVLNIPAGTVMSRLSRARRRLLEELSPSAEVGHELP